MDSLDAQCLVIRLMEGEMPAPDLWRHESSGALSCAYEGGESTFTWPPAAVAELARKWRESNTSHVPEQARLFRDSHERLRALTSQASLRPPDEMVHHLARGELHGIWHEEEIVIVVDEIGAAGARGSAANH